MRKKGFTLIELLVVISIISILASILFPVFAKARDKARQVSCLSNLKQIGTAIMMYTDDYDETFPLAGIVIKGQPGMADTTLTWQDIIQPYAKNTQIFVCPQKTNLVYSIGVNVTCQFDEQVSGVMGQVFYNTDTPYELPSASLCEIVAPSDCYLACDSSTYFIDQTLVRPDMFQSMGWGPRAYGPDYSVIGNVDAYIPGTGDALHVPIPIFSNGGSPYDFKCGRHVGSVNMAFCDGHVKLTRVQEMNYQSVKSNFGVDPTEAKTDNLGGAWSPSND